MFFGSGDAQASGRLTPAGGLRSSASIFTRPTMARVDVTPNTARNVAALFRAGTILAQTQAGLPVCVTQDGKRGFREIPDHRVADMMNLDASDVESGFMLRERLAWDAFWFGDGFAEIEPDGTGKPIYLHYIDPTTVTVEWSETSPRRYVRRYTIRDPKRGEQKLDARDVFHLPGLQFDGLRGRGIVAIARESIAHALAMDQHGASMFGNNAVPAGILKTGTLLTTEDRDAARRAWAKQMHEEKNGVALLDGDFDFKPLGLNNKDTQFLESRAFQVVEISRWTGVPPHMLCDLSKANYNSLETLGGEFKALTLIPWMERWRGETRRKLFTDSERSRRFDVRYDYESLMRADRATRINTARVGVTSGITTVNEEREREGLAPMPGGDVLMTPLNMIPADERPTDGPTVTKAGQPNDAATEPDADDEGN